MTSRTKRRVKAGYRSSPAPGSETPAVGVGAFTEPPPEIGLPDWGTLFQQWWWRKCAHYGIDPMEAFMDMLGQEGEESPNDPS